MDEDDLSPEASGKPARLGVLGGDGLWSVAQVLRASGAEVADLEPAPKTVAAEVAARWHYGRASVRAGLLGHPRACLQLFTAGMPKGWIWKAGSLAVDGLRPEVDPEPMDRALIEAYRLAHLAVGGIGGSADPALVPDKGDGGWRGHGLWVAAQGGDLADGGEAFRSCIHCQ